MSVTYNQRQRKPATATAVNIDVSEDHGSAMRPTTGRRRRSAANSRQLQKQKSADTTETVKRKISSEWDDC